MATAKKEIFVSYGREEEVQAFVIQLKHDLEKNGFTVWLDMEDITAGSDWHAAIGSGLHHCKALIAVITKKYILSRYCTSELYTAEGDSKALFPVIYEDVRFEDSEKSMGVKYVIGGINWLFFRPNVDDYATSLLNLIQGLKKQGLGSEVEGTDSESQLIGQMEQLSVGGNTPPKPSAPPVAVAPVTTPPHPSLTHFYPHQPHAYTSLPRQPYTSPYSQPYGSPYHPSPPHPPYPPSYSVPAPGYQPSPGTYPPPTGYPPTTGPYPPASGPYPPTSGPYPPTSGPYPPTSYPPTSYPPPTSGPYPCTGYPQPPMGTYPPAAPPSYTDIYPHHGGHPVPHPLPPPGGAQAMPFPVKPPVRKLEVNMKLEALDRRFPYYVCVATIIQKRGNEVKIHFDGWTDAYDYWCPTDAIELHPACRGLIGINTLLIHKQNQLMIQSLMRVQKAGTGSLLFRVGMRLEAKDRMNPELICVATVKSIKPNGDLLIHFDGWSDGYDYWCKPDSTDIHPAMWCNKHNKKVTPPKGHIGNFLWNTYLHDPDINPAPAHIFTELQLGVAPSGNRNQLRLFRVGMRLEAKDRANPALICVATITDINNNKLLIHFDGWSNRYDYWCDPDTVDIHPIGWCASKGIHLQPPHGRHGRFTWEVYLQEVGAERVPDEAFTPAQRQ
uniref:TIR domain-containing protein n=1 Tax=Amphimedon queenslandica TaxID=400682 RepID=A0A1X7UYJ4_AMPQE